MKGLPTIIIYKDLEYYLFIAFGEHGKEWECGYKRYYEYSEPDKIESCYNDNLNQCIKDLKLKLKQNNQLHTVT